MEVQQLPQQSVQINLNNKIITLHNVTIVKNPRIVKVDAAQYSNLLKGAVNGNGQQIKFINGGAAVNVKLPMPSLVPMKTAPALIRTSPSSILSSNNSLQNNAVIINQNPVIKQGGNYVQTHVIKSIQPPALAASNKIVQMNQTALVASQQNASMNNPPTLVSPVKFQAIPMKQTVIISPPKISNATAASALSPHKNSPNLVPQNIIKVVQATTPPPLLQTYPQQQQPKEQIAINQTSVITKPQQPPPIIVNSTSNMSPNKNSNNNPSEQPVLPIKTNVIVSPPLKNKNNSNVESSGPSESKKQCTKFEFQCIFCQASFINEPKLLMKHLQEYHAEKIPQQNGNEPPLDINQEAKVTFEEPKQVLFKEQNESLFKDLPKFEVSNNIIGSNNEKYDSKMEPDDSDSDSSTLSDNEDLSDDGSDLDDDDEEEVRDLIMDLENPQENFEDSSENELNEEENDDKGSNSNSSSSSSSSSSDSSDSDENDSDDESSQEDRSNTPESPEFEEHVPENTSENNQESKYDYEEYTGDNYDLDILSILLEPFVDLRCGDDHEENSQEENEAMKLYREAMEINYEQNGIKKRGRRKSRAPKVVANEPLSMNGILANLLDTSIKIPQGPGRGRRKEVNEQELEMDRSNGICFFQCTQCDKSFKFAGDLAKHVRSHTISSPYRCSICGKVFTHIGSLNTHLRIHSGERPYKCKFCDKSFTQSNSLMVHVKSHLSNKPFSCNQCNKGFLNASSLALHQKTHTGPVVVVTCPIDNCGKEFRDNNLLEEHMQTHKQSLLYQCSQCMEKFEQACQLVQHVKIHVGDKPFQCTICSRAFTQPGSLNTHLRIHTGEKPFSCTLCPKRFTQASSLSVHMKIHGEKEFKCEICSKSYNQEAFLLKHKLKHQENNTDSSEASHDLTLASQE